MSKWNNASSKAWSKAKDALGDTLGSVGGAVSTIIDAGISNAKVDTTQADNAIEAVNNYSLDNSSLTNLAASYNSSPFAETSYDHKDFMVSTGEGLANMGKAALTGAAAGASIGGPWGAVGGFAAGVLGSGAGWFAGKTKAIANADRLSREGSYANVAKNTRAKSNVDLIMERSTDEMRENYVAYGGPLFNHSGDFSNDIIFINNGGTHEQNPFGGVLMGVDNEGTPNLVEEGEIIYNDYVFSNRLKPGKKLLADGGFSDKYNDWTFAMIVEDLQNESAERPNDIISKAGLDNMMNRMITMQETIRARKGKTGQNRMINMAANGGNIFDGLTDFRAKLNNYKTTILDDLDKVDLTEGTKDKFDWNTLGMLAPTISNIGKTIYNIAQKPDTSNFITEESYREIPMMVLPRIGGKINYQGIDRNRYINPIISQGRATAKDIQNLGVSSSDVLNRMALNTYNTQKAIADANFQADQQDLSNRLNVGQFNLGIDKTNLESSKAEQLANNERAKLIATGRISDAAMLEQAEQMRGQAIDKTSTAVTQGIADLIRQNIEWNWIKDNPEYASYFNHVANAKNGGMLTKRKRRK